MKLFQPTDGGTVVLLGAGASYGANVENAPPVMKNFIDVGKKIVKHDYSRLWSFLNENGFDSNVIDQGIVNLEEVYTFLEIVSQGLWHKSQEEYLEDFGKALQRTPPAALLESFIFEVLRAPSVSALNKTCVYHDKLLQKYIGDGDTVISFNYDLIVDSSALKSGAWNEQFGYGFIEPYVYNEKESYPEAKFILLKPHGSLNWTIGPNRKRDDTSIVVGRELFQQQISGIEARNRPQIYVRRLNNIIENTDGGLVNGLAIVTAELAEKLQALDIKDPGEKGFVELFATATKQGVSRPTYIVQPGLLKFGNPAVPVELIETWSYIRRALRIAKRIICIGYSFPPNDLHFSNLLRMAIGGNKYLPSIEIVNPDPNFDLNRIQAIAKESKITHICKTLAEFVS